jgi:predicted RNase H-like HicB family nuclease
MKKKPNVVVRAEFFREGDLYVGFCPDLDVSSFGESVDEARRSLREALEAFIEECEAMGTLEEVLEEAGFVREDANWLARQPVSAELVSLG